MSKFYVPINLDIEVEAKDSNAAWEGVYTTINGLIIDMVESNFPNADYRIEVGEPDEVFE